MTQLVVKDAMYPGGFLRIAGHRDLANCGCELLTQVIANLPGEIDQPDRLKLLADIGAGHEEVADALQRLTMACAMWFGNAGTPTPSIAVCLAETGFFAAPKVIQDMICASLGRGFLAAICVAYGEANIDKGEVYPVQFDRFIAATAKALAELMPPKSKIAEA